MAASTLLEAQSWLQAMTEFYANSRRRYVQPYMSSSPVREQSDVRVYTLPRDYMASVAVAMLSAQQEIFITSWKNSPTVLLTRPPLPPLRLDQLLRFKAEQVLLICYECLLCVFCFRFVCTVCEFLLFLCFIVLSFLPCIDYLNVCLHVCMYERKNQCRNIVSLLSCVINRVSRSIYYSTKKLNSLAKATIL